MIDPDKNGRPGISSESEIDTEHERKRVLRDGVQKLKTGAKKLLSNDTEKWYHSRTVWAGASWVLAD